MPNNEAKNQGMTGRNTLKKRLGPGVWIDADDNPHISVPELLEFFELENTPQNFERVQDIIRELLAKHAPKAKVVERLIAN